MEIIVWLLFNIIFGVFGLWDLVIKMGLYKCSEDFGQIFGFYGVGGGFYLMLLIFGLFNLCDIGGLVVDYVGEYQVNYFNVFQVSGDYLEIIVLCVVDRCYNISFCYGQMNLLFEYEKLCYIYIEVCKLQIVE